MPIKNYTTGIDVFQSIGEIQGMLASHGATKVMVDYDGGLPVGITFAIATEYGTRGFSLPANVDGVEAGFSQQGVKAQPGQAERAAWRNIRDWIYAQMAIIEAGMVRMDEVFLPSLVDSQGQTLYQVYLSGQLALRAADMV